MAKTSFVKKPHTAEEAIDAEFTSGPENDGPPNQVVPRQEQPLAQRTNGAFKGDWKITDKRFPRLNLVQKSSDEELIQSFGLGSFILNKEVKLSDGTPMPVIFLSAIKDYIQKVEFGSGETPARFDTEQEVLDSGGSLNWKDKDTDHFFQRRAHIEFAIKAPEGLDEKELALFPYEFNGEAYALAVYTVASSAFTSVAVELNTLCDRNKVMRKGAHYGSLLLSTKDAKSKGKSWKVPVIKFDGENSPELVAFLEEIEPGIANA
jgi:hypothetical protein